MPARAAIGAGRQRRRPLEPAPGNAGEGIGTMDAALVFAGGDAIPRGLGELLDRDRLVIAADSGLDHAHALGFHVDLVVGDLDSVDPDVLRAAA